MTQAHGISPYALAVRDWKLGTIGRFSVGGLAVELATSGDSVWLLIAGEIALRAAYIPVAFDGVVARPRDGEIARLAVTSAMGKHDVGIVVGEDSPHWLRMVVRFTPASATTLPFLPRDLYPLGEGAVEARQRGLNSGIVYLRTDGAAFGSLLYFQNLTALNPFFAAMGTTPEDVVGGEWPELGYRPPTRESPDRRHLSVTAITPPSASAPPGTRRPAAR